MLPFVPPLGFRQPLVAVSATHRYYKAALTGIVAGGGVQALACLELYESIGGADFLQAAVAAATATVTASSTFGGFSVASITDGNNSTDWAGNTTSETIFIDLGSNSANWKEIPQFGFRGRHDILAQCPKDITFYHSDNGSSYTSRFSVANIGYRHTVTCKATDPAYMTAPSSGKHKLWGLHYLTSDVGSFGHIEWAELRDSAGGANRNTGGLPSAQIQYDGSYDPLAGWNGAAGSFAYISQNAYHWYEDAAGSERVKPVEIAIKNTVGFTGRGPRTFDLVYADYNGGPVTIQQSYSTGAWSTAGEIRTFAVT